MQGDASSKGPIGGIGTVYQVQSPNIFLDAYPGCYLIKHSIVNEGTEKPAFEWSSWVQVRGETEEDEKHFLVSYYWTLQIKKSCYKVSFNVNTMFRYVYYKR